MIKHDTEDELTIEDIEQRHNFPEEDRGRLRDEGYQRVIEELGDGEGMTRTVYRVIQGRGDTRREEVLKIPRQEVDPLESIVAAVNDEHVNGNDRELDVLNRVTTRGAARTRGSFRLADGRRVSSEDYKPGSISLQRVVETGISEDTKRELAGQLLQTVDDLHTDDYVIHRDIKPTNIIVDRNNQLILTDFQTATEAHTHWPSLTVPTAGGTAYGHPKRINNFLAGNATAPERDEDLYSVGATLHYLFTGRHPNDRQLISHPDGDEIVVNDARYRVQLLQDNTPPENNRIDLKQEEKRLQQLIKQMKQEKRPKWQRDLVYKCMTHTDKKFNTITAAQDHFRKTTSRKHRLEGILDEAITGFRRFGWATGAATILGLSLYALLGPLSDDQGFTQDNSPRVAGLLYLDTDPNESGTHFEAEQVYNLPSVARGALVDGTTKYARHSTDDRSIAYLVDCFAKTNMSIGGLRRAPILTDYQEETFAANSTPEERAALENRKFGDLLAENYVIPARALEIAISQLQDETGRVDLEDALVVGRLGPDVLAEAQALSRSENYRVYINAQRSDGSRVIPENEQEFLNQWLAYVHDGS